MGVDKGDEQQNEKEVNEEENGEDDINEEEEEEEEEEENVDQDVKRMERYEEPVASDKNIDLEELEMLCSNLGVPYHKVTFHLLTKSCGEDTKVWIKTRKLLIDRGVIIIPLHRVNDKGTIWESKPVVLPIVKQLRYTYCVQSTKLFGKINVKEEDFTRPIRDSKHIFEGTVSIKDYSFKKDIFIFWLSHFIKQINSSESFRKQLKLLEALQNCNKRYEPPWRTDCIYYLSKELQNNGNSMNVFQKLFLSLTIGLFPPFRGREMKKVEISHKILLDLEEFLIDLAESQPDAAKRISQHITDWALDVFQSKFVPFLCSNLSPHSSQWIKLLKHPLICPSQLIQAADFYAKVSIREILNEIVKLQDFIKHSSRSYYFKLISSLIPKMTSIDLLIELLSLDCENVLHLHEISNFADAQAAGEPIHQKGDFLSGLMVSNIVNNDFIKQYKDKNLPKSLSDPSSMWCFNHQIVRLLNNYKSLDQLIDLFNSFPLNLKSISMQHFQNAILNLIKKENNIEEKYIKQLIKHKELFYPVEQHQQQQANPIGEESLIEKLSSTIIGNTKYCYLFPSILKYRISQCNEYHQEILTVDWFKTYNQSSSEMGGYKSVSLIYPYIKSNEKLIDTLLKSSEQHAIQFSEIDILKNANYINQFSSIPEIQRSYYELIERILPSYATTSLHAVHSLGYILSPSSSSSSDNKEGGDNELSNYTIPSKFIESLIIQLISLPSVECSKIHEVFDKNNFWLKVLKLSGEINSLKINHKYKLVKSIYNDFIDDIKNQTITLGNIASFSHHSNELILENILQIQSQNKNSKSKIGMEDIEAMKMKLTQFTNQLQMINTTVSTFAGECADYNEYLADIENQRLKFPSIKLNQLDSIWKTDKYENHLNEINELYQYRSSICFMNIFKQIQEKSLKSLNSSKSTDKKENEEKDKEEEKKDGEDQEKKEETDKEKEESSKTTKTSSTAGNKFTFEFLLHQLFPIAVKKFVNSSKRFLFNQSNVTVRRAAKLWTNVSLYNYESELQFIVKQINNTSNAQIFTPENYENIKSIVNKFVKKNATTELVEEMLRIFEIFKVQTSPSTDEQNKEPVKEKGKDKKHKEESGKSTQGGGNSENEIYFNCKEYLTIIKDSSKPVEVLINWITKISNQFQSFNEYHLEVIKYLSYSKEICEFLSSALEEDFRTLIDAVEENGDQFIRESTVSDFIEVKRFLYQLLVLSGSNQFSSVSQFIDSLNENLKKYEKSIENGLHLKIQSTNENIHGLIRLYQNVANRGEVTRDIILAATTHGSFIFNKKSDIAKPTVIMKISGGTSNNHTVNYNISEINDFRSRALLIVNTERMSNLDTANNTTSGHSTTSQGKDDDEEQNEQEKMISKWETEQQTMRGFISTVDLVQQILTCIEKLSVLGHFNYRLFQGEFSSHPSLVELFNKLQSDLIEWEKILNRARKLYYYLNYFHSYQLWILEDFFNKLENEYNQLLSDEESYKKIVLPAIDLLRYVNQSLPIDIKKLKVRKSRSASVVVPPSPSSLIAGQSKSENDLFQSLKQIGRQLNKIFSKKAIHKIEIPGDFELTTDDQGFTLIEGEVNLIPIPDEGHLINAIMSVYHFSGYYPDPSNLLICEKSTTWEDIYLLLLRCFYSMKFPEGEKLYCIANVDQLDYELQNKLSNTIKKLTVRNKCKWFVIIGCKKGLSQFPTGTVVQSGTGLTNATVSKLLTLLRPEIVCVTSEFPGLGKTETIKSMAFESRKNINTFSISGPLDINKLILRFKSLEFNHKLQSLHINISEVDNGRLLNRFLFQLTILGMIKSLTLIYHLCTFNIYIEIANTLQQHLLYNLYCCSYFKQKRLSWSIDRLIISKEILAPIQISCIYLDAFDNDKLDLFDLLFEGKIKNVKPLDDKQCIKLLDKYFFVKGDAYCSFSVLNTFIKVFSDQLLRLSKSSFFRIQTLKGMVDSKSVRKMLVQSLLEVALDFATRSVGVSKSLKTTIPSQVSLASLQQKHTRDEENGEATKEPQGTTPGGGQMMFSNPEWDEMMVQRLQGMIEWQQTNHLLVMFQTQDSHSICALYRDKKLVPKEVKELLSSQSQKREQWELEDYQTMEHEELLLKLEKIARTTREEKQYPPYSITSDNLLKMALIIQRVRVGVPVVIMGETGCGKTSLIKFLAKAVDVSFRTLNFHAGITEDDILLFMSEIHKLARHGSVWVFFDEINTCDHLGLINEMICNRTLLGRPLNRKIVILAACNPYRFKTVRVQYDSGASAGLQDKLLNNPNKTDLVYRVHPLPESMLDYIWDYGSLDNQEERSYIEMMVKSSHNNQLIADLLVASQSFMRDKISAWSVSLRDVKRCRKLLRWFKEHLSVRSKVGKVSSWYERSKFIPQKLRSVKRPIRIMILALAHCYHSRLGKSEDRLEYREMISKVFKAHKIQLSADNFATVLAEEQLDYLQRMELPPAIALNEALRENVFVILVCILNQIPVFVVGSPGCSKSLSMRLINSNLRGPDSKDPFFQKLPQVYIVSYQGSESSTSEGIIKVFDKARKYKEHNPSVIPVVLLDEVGLAEVSKYNPLKVLHSLLEPDYPAEYPDVAVVGLSNWGLDAAKMNRAIVLSRPPPDTKDLVDTAYEIQSQLSKTGDILNKNLLSQIAKAYCYYQSNQKYSNFHGLRDFYSFIRNLCSIDKFDEKSLLYSLRRNFGGIKLELSVIEKQFTNQLNFIASSASSNSSNSNTSTGGGGNDSSMVLELIHDNLVDQQARHLMLITKGDSAISILESQLQEKKRVMIIYGSQFEDDLSEEYSYVVLSQIILSMEKGSCLILKDLELVYGSLYDMLNQNYTIVGNKRNCRIALGAFSNPMCHVHPDFRCIVLVDKDKVDYSDPPFLNRFEKQELTYDDILSNTQKEAYQSLSKWIKSITTVTNHHEFEIEDAITTYSEDSLRSLILYHSSDDCSFEQLLWKCKNQLMIEMRLDQVVRAQHSPFAISNAAGGNESPFKKLMQQYWENSFDDLPKYIEYALNQRKSGDLQWVEGAGACFIVHTLDNIHQSLMDCLSYLPSDLNVQIDPINSITSQRQLLNVIRKYWEDPNQNLHLIECDSRTDSKHLTLVRYLINQSRREYLKKNQGKVIKDKHVGIIIQSYSSSSNIPSIKSTNTSNNLASSSVNHSNLHADYLTGWNYIYIDNLLPLSISRNVLFSHSILYILEHANFAGLLSQQFLKAFRFISYPKKNTKKYIKGLIDNTLKCEELIECFKHRIFEWIRINKNNDTLWQYNVLCKKSSIRSNCTNTLIDHVHSLIRAPLAMLIYELEKYYLLGRYFEIDDEDYKTQWRILFKDATILPIDHLLIPNKPKALQIQPPYDPNQFKFYTTLQQPNYGAKVVISTNLDELPVLEKPSLPKENEKNIIEENDDELESLEKLTDFI